MEDTALNMGQAVPAGRKRWEAPCIVLERSLEVSAQGGPPTGAQGGVTNGFIGPLGLLGGSGTCSGT